MFSLNKKLLVALFASAAIAGSAVAGYNVKITNMSGVEARVRIERPSIFCPTRTVILQPNEKLEEDFGGCCTSSIRVNPTNDAQDESFFNMSDISTGAGWACRGYILNIKMNKKGGLFIENLS